MKNIKLNQKKTKEKDKLTILLKYNSGNIKVQSLY